MSRPVSPSRHMRRTLPRVGQPKPLPWHCSQLSHPEEVRQLRAKLRTRALRASSEQTGHFERYSTWFGQARSLIQLLQSETKVVRLVPSGSSTRLGKVRHTQV